MVEEKRRYIRWNKKIRVTYSLSKDAELDKEVFTEDISEVGLQILSQEGLEAGQIIKLKLEFIYDSIPIIVDAKVVFSKMDQHRYRIGLEFNNLSDFDKRRLKLCLEEAEQDKT